MDIVSRLKLYLEKNQIPNSKFADDCGISRPTLSQILNGRNKKISDELISKIHVAFPDMSIMWLMFGEGPMILNDVNSTIQSNENYHVNSDGMIFEGEINNGDLFSGIESLLKGEEADVKTSSNAATNGQSMNISKNLEAMKKANITNRQISSILVFYSDNTFEKFVPK